MGASSGSKYAHCVLLTLISGVQPSIPRMSRVTVKTARKNVRTLFASELSQRRSITLIVYSPW
jgi:hypothetical protein